MLVCIKKKNMILQFPSRKILFQINIKSKYLKSVSNIESRSDLYIFELGKWLYKLYVLLKNKIRSLLASIFKCKYLFLQCDKKQRESERESL